MLIPLLLKETRKVDTSGLTETLLFEPIWINVMGSCLVHFPRQLKGATPFLSVLWLYFQTEDEMVGWHH